MTATIAEQLAHALNPAYGDCSYCGRTYVIQADGRIKGHMEWRVRAKWLEGGRLVGEAYRSKVPCAGGGLEPGPTVELYNLSEVAA